MKDSDFKVVAGNAPRDPEQLEASAEQTDAELPATTRLGPVHLTVAALEPSIEYYVASVGLTLHDKAAGRPPSASATGSCSSSSRSRALGAPSGIRASTISPCSCRNVRISLVGWRMRRGSVSLWSASPTTS
jgi:hypothetical protein